MLLKNRSGLICLVCFTVHRQKNGGRTFELTNTLTLCTELDDILLLVLEKINRFSDLAAIAATCHFLRSVVYLSPVCFPRLVHSTLNLRIVEFDDPFEEKAKKPKSNANAVVPVRAYRQMMHDLACRRWSGRFPDDMPSTSLFYCMHCLKNVSFVDRRIKALQSNLNSELAYIDSVRAAHWPFVTQHCPGRRGDNSSHWITDDESPYKLKHFHCSAGDACKLDGSCDQSAMDFDDVCDRSDIALPKAFDTEFYRQKLYPAWPPPDAEKLAEEQKRQDEKLKRRQLRREEARLAKRNARWAKEIERDAESYLLLKNGEIELKRWVIRCTRSPRGAPTKRAPTPSKKSAKKSSKQKQSATKSTKQKQSQNKSSASKQSQTKKQSSTTKTKHHKNRHLKMKKSKVTGISTLSRSKNVKVKPAHSGHMYL